MNPDPTRRRILLGLLPALMAPLPTAAQETAGSWWEIGAAAGGARLTCELCDPSRDLGASLGAAVGAYANPRLRVGIEGGAWTHQDGDVRESVYRTGLVAHLHPMPRSGLHLIGGAGWSGYRAQEFTYDAARLTLGAGWDLPLTGGWVAGNRLTLDASSYGSLKNAGTRVTRPVGLSLLRLGVYMRRH